MMLSVLILNRELIVILIRVVIGRGSEHGRSHGNALLGINCRRRSRLRRSLKDLLLLLLLLFLGLLLEIVSKARLLVIHIDLFGFGCRVASKKLLA